MPNRAQRRAAERFASQTSAEPTPNREREDISAARLAANRANAQHSSGPTSASGKAKASLNALKTGLTGVTVMLPSESADSYKAHILSYEKQFQPVGPEESALVQSIADIRWRLNRIPALELALITIGRQELAGQHESFDRAELDPILEMEIRRAYEKDFRNLHLQENRLARRREKEMAELRTLQSERKAKETEDLKQLAKHYIYAQSANKTFDPAALGFEFSKELFIRYLAREYPGVNYEEAPETKQATA